MKLTSLPLEEDGFKSYPVEFCGIESYLIIPDITAKWTKQNLCYRSLIVRGSDFFVLSSGWPKFFNEGEKPDAYPDPTHFKDWQVTDKIDGSLLILDYMPNGEYSMRTRGTASYITQNNSEDFEQLFEKYPKLKNWTTTHQSLLFEIVTPNNVIVIHPTEIDFVFLGAVDKTDLTVVSTNDCKVIAECFDLRVPQSYNAKSIVELSEQVKTWTGKEGVVLSYNNNQNRIKIKSDWYLVRHRLKSELNSENNFVDLYVDEGMPDYQTFFEIIEKVTDFETATAFQGRISKAVGASQEVKRILSHMDEFVKDIRNLKSRKEQAETIIRSYGNTNRASFVFCKLDNKPLNNDQIIKLFWQVLKK